MMPGVSDVSDRYETVAAGFTARLVAITPDEWSGPTPCPDWTVQALVAHVIGTQRAVLTRLDESTPAPVDADGDGDLVAQWQEAWRAVSDALRDDARASTIVGGMFGEQSFTSLVGRLVCTDLLVHTWDLARATAQDERLDVAAVSSSEAFLASIDDAIRAPGGFAEKITPTPDADDQTRFLNFCGRAV
jgi:uncharacterized protein (TIGR03086 family)